MSLVDRQYPDIVRDVLTNLTQGVTGEPHHIVYDPLARPLAVPDVTLLRRPVRRVSFVGGFVTAPNPSDPPVPYTFSLNDYELVPGTADPMDLNTIRFLPFGRKPAPNSDITVNYYPRNTDPAVVNDLNVGSVVRTLLEAVGKELAVLYAQLNLAYDNAYLESATGPSLERVVALLGYTRFKAGRAVGTVTFSRRAGAIGNITIPAGTPVTDAADKLRYETSETHDLLAGETTAQVRVRGAADSTPPVDSGVLTVIQRSIAGLDTVVNERPTTRASDDETDGELRGRARSALLASNNGTVEAITFGLLQMPEVRDVKIAEMPNGVPGEIAVSVSLVDPPADPSKLPPSVQVRIEELRPAGVRVVSSAAASLGLKVSLKLVLAGSTLPPADIEKVHAGARQTLVSEIKKKGVGEKIRIRPLAAALLRDQRIADVEITIARKDDPTGTPNADFDPPSDATVQLDSSDVAFEADGFEKPLAATGQAIPVEVRAALTAHPLAGISVDDVKTAISARLSQFFSRLAPGTTVDLPALLTALRDDSKYGIDPLKLKVTLTAQDQFVQILSGGPAFTVLPNQTFTVAGVEVSA
ncbi:MAG TPA: baseplate J/gp47 family protein [Chloroflexota bacterium]|nr:baseplate J/gp47 family protein [Chloroflexota bacterium]